MLFVNKLIGGLIVASGLVVALSHVGATENPDNGIVSQKTITVSSKTGTTLSEIAANVDPQGKYDNRDLVQWIVKHNLDKNLSTIYSGEQIIVPVIGGEAQ